MKNVWEILESILDVDNIEAKTKSRLLIREFCSKYKNVFLKNGTSKPLDALGKPLKEGDLVLARYVNSQIRLGIIIEIREDMCFVCYSMDPKEMEQMKTPSGEYRTAAICNEVMKITPKIAEMILHVK